MKKIFDETETLSRAITNLGRAVGAESTVVYKSKRYGMIWAGKLRYFRNALSFEALQKTDFEIIYSGKETWQIIVP